MTDPKKDAEPVIEFITEIPVRYIIAALALGIVLGALVIVMLPDRLPEEPEHE